MRKVQKSSSTSNPPLETKKKRPSKVEIKCAICKEVDPPGWAKTLFGSIADECKLWVHDKCAKKDPLWQNIYKSSWLCDNHSQKNTLGEIHV